MSKVLDKMLAYLIIIVMFAVVAIVLAIPVWLLWNWLMPTIFGVTKITIIQSRGSPSLYDSSYCILIKSFI